MAPCVACEAARNTARSNAQFETERVRKGFRREDERAQFETNDFER